MDTNKLNEWGEELARELGWDYCRATLDGTGLLFIDGGGRIKAVEVDPDAEGLACYRIKAEAVGEKLCMEVMA